MLGVNNAEQKLKAKMDELGYKFTVTDLIDKATFMELCSSVAAKECFKNN